MQFGDQKVTRVYAKIAYEFNVMSYHLQCNQTRSKADFTGVLACFMIELSKCITPHEQKGLWTRLNVHNPIASNTYYGKKH